MNLSRIFHHRTVLGMALMTFLPLASVAQVPEDWAGLHEIPFSIASEQPQQLTLSNLTNSTIGKLVVQGKGGTLDASLSETVSKAFRLGSGEQFDPVQVQAGLAAVRDLPAVKTVHLRLFESPVPNQLYLLLEVEPASVAAPAPPSRVGVLMGMPNAFPVLYRDRRSLLLAGGMVSGSFFGGINTWFNQSVSLNTGNPLALRPSGASATWGEAFATLSLTGITTLSPNLYGYMEASVLGGGTAGQEVYDSRGRGTVALELANAGVAYATKRASGQRFAVNARVGRQNYRLGEGLIIVAGAGNGSDRGNLFLLPRQAFEQSGLLQVRYNDVKLEGFVLNPNEVPVIDTNTHLQGANLEYANRSGLMAAATYLTVPKSTATYLSPTFAPLPREGLQVWNFRARVPLGRELTLAGEYVQQTHDDFDMRAQAFSGTVSYRPKRARQNPVFSYRYSRLSGDNPNTSRFERYDPLFGGGTIDTWANSFNLAFVFANSNIHVHRLRTDLVPNPRSKVTLQYSYLSADQSWNAGGPAPLTVLNSKYLGQEVGFAGQYFVNQNTVLVGAAALSMPGSAFRSINGRGNWVYLQAGILYAF